MKYVKTKWDIKYSPANCIKQNKTKKAGSTYVYSISKTGPLPWALWMSDKSLFAAKVPCVRFFFSFSFFLCMFTFIIFHSSSLSNVDKDSYSYMYQRTFCSLVQTPKPTPGGEGLWWARWWRFCPHPSTSATPHQATTAARPSPQFHSSPWSFLYTASRTI